jgi:RHS repeat-associated protein
LKYENGKSQRRHERIISRRGAEAQRKYSPPRHHRPGTPPPAHDFGYDTLDRLDNVVYLGSPTDNEVFPMDDLGNRIGTVEQRDANHTYAVDSLTNRYTAIDAAPLAHDTAGNLTRDRQNYRYEYDYENRIARIYRLSGETQDTVASFDYDALGHRVRKIDAIAGTTTLYYNDPEWRVLAEYNGTDVNPQRTFVWGNYIDEPLRMRAGESDYYYLHDHLYSPAVLIGYESGQWRPVERYEYDAYGTARVINRGPDNAWFTADDVVTGSSAINTTLFTGRTLDTLDSANLKIMYYRHRYTDPFTGRFLQQDPIGIDPAGGKENSFSLQKLYYDGMNLYQYLNSGPVVSIDPFGLIDPLRGYWHYLSNWFRGDVNVIVSNENAIILQEIRALSELQQESQTIKDLAAAKLRYQSRHLSCPLSVSMWDYQYSHVVLVPIRENIGLRLTLQNFTIRHHTTCVYGKFCLPGYCPCGLTIGLCRTEWEAWDVYDFEWWDFPYGYIGVPYTISIRWHEDYLLGPLCN